MVQATDIFTVLKDCARESGSLGQGIGGDVQEGLVSVSRHAEGLYSFL